MTGDHRPGLGPVWDDQIVEVRWLGPLEGGAGRLQTTGDELIVKLRWTFRR